MANTTDPTYIYRGRRVVMVGRPASPYGCPATVLVRTAATPDAGGFYVLVSDLRAAR